MSRLNKIYLGTNTKMYKTIKDTISFLQALDSNTQDIDRKLMELFVIPSYTALAEARKSVPRSSIKLGAQNMGWAEEGQYTGEISPLMLTEVGTEIVMVGHSERRHVLGETDPEENQKVLCALEHGFTPLLCIGEQDSEKKYGIADETLSTQLKIGLHGVTPKQAQNIWIAYEPVWAIGVNGVPASKEYASEKHRVIKDVLTGLFGREVGNDIPVLYGGSVNPDNAPELIQMPYIDGLFIGRSAWNADNFNKIIRQVLPLFFDRKKLQ